MAYSFNSNEILMHVQDGNASGEEGANVDWTTDDELEIFAETVTSPPPSLTADDTKVITGTGEVETKSLYID